MKRHIAIILLSLCCLSSLQARQKKEQLINFGVKTGFSSTMYEVQQLQIADRPINEYTTKSEISSFYTAFARFNINRRHYLQTEASYNISNYTIVFATQQWDTNAFPQDLSSISTKITGIEAPLFYGYHIIKEGPYGMSFYAGPKAKLILTNNSRHHFVNFPYESISETIRPINFSLLIGMGINIRNVFFDFSFEYGLHNISKGFTVVDFDEYTSYDDFIFNRRKSVLSFSIGFIF